MWGRWNALEINTGAARCQRHREGLNIFNHVERLPSQDAYNPRSGSSCRLLTGRWTRQPLPMNGGPSIRQSGQRHALPLYDDTVRLRVFVLHRQSCLLRSQFPAPLFYCGSTQQQHGILATVAQCLWTPCKPKRRPPTFRVGTSSYAFLNENKKCSLLTRYFFTITATCLRSGSSPKAGVCLFLRVDVWHNKPNLWVPLSSHSGDSER